jgi:hypothetical protein
MYDGFPTRKKVSSPSLNRSRKYPKYRIGDMVISYADIQLLECRFWPAAAKSRTACKGLNRGAGRGPRQSFRSWVRFADVFTRHRMRSQISHVWVEKACASCFSLHRGLHASESPFHPGGWGRGREEPSRSPATLANQSEIVTLNRPGLLWPGSLGLVPWMPRLPERCPCYPS